MTGITFFFFFFFLRNALHLHKKGDDESFFVSVGHSVVLLNFRELWSKLSQYLFPGQNKECFLFLLQQIHVEDTFELLLLGFCPSISREKNNVLFK